MTPLTSGQRQKDARKNEKTTESVDTRSDITPASTHKIYSSFKSTFDRLCFTTEIAPRFMQLASKLAYATSAHIELPGSIARPIANAEIAGNFPRARLE